MPFDEIFHTQDERSTSPGKRRKRHSAGAGDCRGDLQVERSRRRPARANVTVRNSGWELLSLAGKWDGDGSPTAQVDIEPAAEPSKGF